MPGSLAWLSIAFVTSSGVRGAPPAPDANLASAAEATAEARALIGGGSARAASKVGEVARSSWETTGGTAMRTPLRALVGTSNTMIDLVLQRRPLIWARHLLWRYSTRKDVIPQYLHLWPNSPANREAAGRIAAPARRGLPYRCLAVQLDLAT